MSRDKNITLENVKLIFRNFAGKESQYNSSGRRNFCIVLTPDMADKLVEEGLNVKTKAPRDPEDNPLLFIQVSVRYENFPPKIFTVTKRNKILLTEETVGILDYAEIDNVDVTLNAHYWEVNGKSGYKAYVKSMYVTIAEDPLAAKYDYAEESDTDEAAPF